METRKRKPISKKVKKAKQLEFPFMKEVKTVNKYGTNQLHNPFKY